MKTNALIIDGEYYAWVSNPSKDDCTVCALRDRCKSLSEGSLCNAFPNGVGYTFRKCERVESVRKIGNKRKLHS